MLLTVDLTRQCLTVYQNHQIQQQYPVSTAANGAGERNGSGGTPRGCHIIRAKIGADCPSGTVFVARRPTGEIFSEALRQQYPQRDWILSRILWLSGCEVGKNRLGPVDTMRRYIYLHGTADEHLLGQAVSHGCIRMANRDIIALFDQVDAGTEVLIK